MPKLILRGAFIRFVDLRYDEKSKQTYTRLEFSSDYSDRVQEAMKWQPLPAGFDAAKLAGELSLSELVLTPNGGQLKQHTLELSAKEMSGFTLAKVKASDGRDGRNSTPLPGSLERPESRKEAAGISRRDREGARAIEG
jgi:hypothetical protein